VRSRYTPGNLTSRPAWPWPPPPSRDVIVMALRIHWVCARSSDRYVGLPMMWSRLGNTKPDLMDSALRALDVMILLLLKLSRTAEQGLNSHGGDNQVLDKL
jgi:hypothetical protein